MIGPINLTELLRNISSSMQTPVVFTLLLMIAFIIFIAGSLVAEIFTERMYIKVKMNTVPELIEKIHSAGSGEKGAIEKCINDSNLLKRHKEALIEVTRHPDITDMERESLAVRLIAREKAVYDRRVRVTDLIAKLGPMLGLMGTLIPLGPGIIALGRKDTFTLSNSMLVAFDTTVAGLLCAFIALIISAIRKTWYKNDMSVLETLMECILEEEQQDD